MADLPIYIWALLLAAVLGIPAVTGVMLYRAAVTAGLGRRAGTGVAGAFTAGWGAWLLVTGYLASTGVYSAPGGPWFLVAVTGALVLLLLASRIPLVAGLLNDPRTSALLVLPHTLRVLGVVFLILMIQGHLPAVFAVPAALGDIATGVAAPFLARRLARGSAHRAAVRFHVLGILDLIVAAGIAALITSGLLEATPSTDLLRLLPLALVPTAAVPLAVALHIVALRQLHTAAARSTATTSSPVNPRTKLTTTVRVVRTRCNACRKQPGDEVLEMGLGALHVHSPTCATPRRTGTARPVPPGNRRSPPRRLPPPARARGPPPRAPADR